MIPIIITCLLAGIFIGYFSGIPLNELSNYVITLGLFVLLFSVGIDLGSNKEILKNIKASGMKLFIIPIGTALGTIVGSLAAGIILSMPLKESVAVGAGFGWYSLSGVLITQLYNVELGTMAFISNVIREVIALLAIPFVSRYIGSMEAIGIAGATAMDTSLPVIVKYNTPDMVIFSFLSGVLLTLLVPILIPIILNM
ncbi:MAG: lysine exporter LysO family protein [Thermoanaerobacteraceae bacterium]|nr:lysine exporter LysO family protein [Thermoanaerobacteraceae bacterium]